MAQIPVESYKPTFCPADSHTRCGYRQELRGRGVGGVAGSFDGMPSDAVLPNDEELIPAATVILGRDTTAGLEVLMLRRNSKIAFGGAWVFPGGRVDDDDLGHDDLTRARSAAIRESAEETGLDIVGRPLGVWSYWVPPPMSAMVVEGKKRRFGTWFFIGHAPDTGVEIDMGEIHEHRWLRPHTALELHRSGEIELIPPTWITLHELCQFVTVDAAVSSAIDTSPPRFVTYPIPGDPTILAWEGDVAYRNRARVDEPGGRNRLIMDKGNWAYERR
jgi:8-oxo-dGTP pyrophosphatase MutT (NUDIX family)